VNILTTRTIPRCGASGVSNFRSRIRARSQSARLPERTSGPEGAASPPPRASGRSPPRRGRRAADPWLVFEVARAMDAPEGATLDRTSGSPFRLAGVREPGRKKIKPANRATFPVGSALSRGPDAPVARNLSLTADRWSNQARREGLVAVGRHEATDPTDTGNRRFGHPYKRLTAGGPGPPSDSLKEFAVIAWLSSRPEPSRRDRPPGPQTGALRDSSLRPTS
jgi:hypothetical protein